MNGFDFPIEVETHWRRRTFLSRIGGGIGLVALQSLLQGEASKTNAENPWLRDARP